MSRALPPVYFCDILCMYDLQSFLRDCIERSERQIDLEQQQLLAEPQSPSASRRVGQRQELINEVVAQCFAAGVDSIRAIKSSFFHRNEQLPLDAQFHFVNGGEIRAKLRELRGEDGLSQVQSEGARVAALQRSIAQQRRLMETLHGGELELKRLRDARDKADVESDYTESIVKDVSPCTDVTALNFDAYCMDVVQKRLYDDVAPQLQCMRQGFASVYSCGLSECDLLKLMKVSDVQHKLFPLDPVTVDAFRKNSRFRDGANAKLMWKVMQEDLSQEQVQNVFYFATNWHTVSGAPRKVEIAFEQRDHRGDLAPRAATCSWSLCMPDCIAHGDDRGSSQESRERMKQGARRLRHMPPSKTLTPRAALLIAANSESQGYGFG